MEIKGLSETYVKFIMYMLIVVLINAAGLRLFFRADLTEHNIYSLSEPSKKAVKTLSEPLTIKAFFTKDLPAPHNNTRRYLRDLLMEYDTAGNRYFNYRFYDISPGTEGGAQESGKYRETARSYGISPVQIQTVEKDEVKFKRAYMGLVLIHGDMVERIPAVTSEERLEYKLTTAIQKLNNKVSAFLRLQGKVDVNLYMSSALEKVAPHMGLKNLPSLPQRIKETVEELNKKNYGKLAYTHVDPSTKARIEDIAESHDIMALEWPSVPERDISEGHGVLGLVLEHKDRTRSINLLDVSNIPLIGTRYELVEQSRIKEEINSNLEILLGIHEDLGYLADHGTPQLPRFSMPGMNRGETLSVFSGLISKNYSIKNIRLKDEPIPEGLKTLLICRPKKEFSDYELYQIDQALMRGTNLAVFMNGLKEKSQNNQQNPMLGQRIDYSPMDTGLEKLLKHYGVRVKPSFVMDRNCYNQRMPQEYGGGERPIYFAPLIKDKFINKELEFMKNIRRLLLLKVSPVELVQDRIEEFGLTAHRLLASSRNSWEMVERINLNPMAIRPPSSEKEEHSMPLAYLLEGTFESYFSGKEIPEKEVQEDKKENGGKKDESHPRAPQDTGLDMSKVSSKGRTLYQSKPAEIFLIGSSEILKDNLLDRNGKDPNSTFIMNVIDALNDREEIAVMRSKVQKLNPLRETGEFTRSFTKVFNIAAIPGLVVLAGLFIWLRRNSRKRKIRMMFWK